MVCLGKYGSAQEALAELSVSLPHRRDGRFVR